MAVTFLVIATNFDRRLTSEVEPKFESNIECKVKSKVQVKVESKCETLNGRNIARMAPILIILNVDFRMKSIAPTHSFIYEISCRQSPENLSVEQTIVVSVIVVVVVGL